MKYGYSIFKRILPVLAIGMAVVACETPESASLFDENYNKGTTPVITSVSPENEFFAGYQQVTITGSNFTANTSELFVYFNNVRAQIISATPTQVVVRTPNLVADSIGIKVGVLGVEAFSNSVQYKLSALFRNAVSFPDNENPWAVASDANGNYFVSYEASGSPAGIKKVGPDGTTVLNPTYGSAQTWFYRSAKVGPDGGVYLIRGGAVPFLYRIAPDGGVPASWGTGIGRTEDVAFDPSGNAWTGGTNEGNASNARLNRISPARVVTRYPFNAQIYALTYFNNHIYIAGTRGPDSFVWKVELLANLIPGEEQVVANLTGSGAVGRPTAMAIARDGTVFVGMNGANPLYQVSVSGQVSEMYPGIIPGTILKMEYLSGSQNLLMTLLPSTGNNRVISLNVQKDAP
jgi:hypothetical protein